MKELFASVLVLLGLGVAFIAGQETIEKSYQNEIKFYNQTQQLKTKCEKDLPRTETCVLMYLNPDEIKTLGKDVNKE